MQRLARVERHDAVAVITLDNPPVNALSHALRLDLVSAFAFIEADSTIQAVVIACAGNTFSVGADVRELGGAPLQPSMGSVMRDVIDATRCLLVFGLHGHVLGGGLELALLGDYRVALRGTRLGLPEITLGLIPGGGGTQRLPRLIGAAAALEMILSGAPLDADAALQAGLIDEIADVDVIAAAVAAARRMIGAPERRLRLSHQRPSPSTTAFVAVKEAALCNARLPAVALAISAVEAATTMDFESGLAKEAQLFAQARESVESRALRHIFAGERIVAKIPGISADIADRTVQNCAVIGAGTMGIGVSIALLDAGYSVALVEATEKGLARGVSAIRATYDGLATRGRIAASARDERLSRLHPTLTLEAVSDCDLIIECIFEDMKAKRLLFADLGRAAKPQAVLATNTSALDVNIIAEACGRAHDVVGMHFFSPANVMKLVEVVRADHTAPDVLATAMAVSRRMGKIGVLSEVCDGFIGNRLIGGYLREAGLLLLEGAAPAQIDSALQRFGMAMGPHAMGDLAGLDIQAAARARRRAEGRVPADPRVGAVGDALVAAGRLGLKVGKGIYAYADGSRAPLPDQEVTLLIRREAARLGVTQRSFTDDEIIDRCLLPIVNEGARVLAEGVSLGAVDIDVIYVRGYGFPRNRGGPMFWADTQGLANVVAKVEAFGADLGEEYWQPSPLLKRLAADGASFGELVRGANHVSPRAA